jgi:NTE family protein
MLLASACLPKIHHAGDIDGETYWDGGYSANPAVYPLFYESESSDVLLVLLSPLQRDGTPRTVEEIEARIVELAFSAHFMREMRMFSHAVDHASPGVLTMGRLERRLQKMRFHMIDSSQLASLQRTDTKLLAPRSSSDCGHKAAPAPPPGLPSASTASGDAPRWT